MKAMVSSTHSSLLRTLRQVIGPEATAGESNGDDRKMPIMVIEALNSEPWVSATFSGHRHWLELRLHGCPGGFQSVRERLATRLEEAEFELSGHILADIALVDSVVQTEHDGQSVCRMTLEALTIED